MHHWEKWGSAGGHAMSCLREGICLSNQKWDFSSWQNKQMETYMYRRKTSDEVKDWMLGKTHDISLSVQLNAGTGDLVVDSSWDLLAQSMRVDLTNQNEGNKKRSHPNPIWPSKSPIECWCTPAFRKLAENMLNVTIESRQWSDK